MSHRNSGTSRFASADEYAPWYRDNPDYQESDDYPMNTIGCVTGFLFNMVDRTVQLISPCTATDEWPLGFYVYG